MFHKSKTPKDKLAEKLPAVDNKKAGAVIAGGLLSIVGFFVAKKRSAAKTAKAEATKAKAAVKKTAKKTTKKATPKKK